jgi:hypothetical protein
LSIYYALVNKQQNSRLRLLDLDAFSKVVDLLTHYALDPVMTKWLNTKIIGLAIDVEEEEVVKFKLKGEEAYTLRSLRPICLLAYALLLQYSLLCKH